jgi:hypothetical protein
MRVRCSGPATTSGSGEDLRVATYSVNEAGVEHARQLIDKRRFVLSSRWGDVQPDADAENAYLKRHSWDEYGAWHLALTEGPGAET